MLSRNILEDYNNLDIGSNLAIRFIDGTILKGTVLDIRSDAISIKRVSMSFSQKNTDLKLAHLDLKLDTFETMIYSVK